jgi:Na+/proline symporter
MVVVDTIAVAIMVSNHIVVPLMLRRRGFTSGAARYAGARDLGGVVLGVRRVAIVVITMLGYCYYRVSSETSLASIGLLSFARSPRSRRLSSVACSGGAGRRRAPARACSSASRSGPTCS